MISFGLRIAHAGERGLARVGDFAGQRLQRLAGARAGNAHDRDRRRRAAGGEGEDGVAGTTHYQVEANRSLRVKAKRIRLHVTNSDAQPMTRTEQAPRTDARQDGHRKTAARKTSKPKCPPSNRGQSRRATRCARIAPACASADSGWSRCGFPIRAPRNSRSRRIKDSLAIANSPTEAEDQAFVDSVSCWNSEEARELEKREPPMPWWRTDGKSD